MQLFLRKYEKINDNIFAQEASSPFLCLHGQTVLIVSSSIILPCHLPHFYYWPLVAVRVNSSAKYVF